MTDDPFKAPSTSIHADRAKPPRVVVFALLGIIAIASTISVGNYRRSQLRRAVVQRLKAERAVEAAQAAENYRSDKLQSESGTSSPQ